MCPPCGTIDLSAKMEKTEFRVNGGFYHPHGENPLQINQIFEEIPERPALGVFKKVFAVLYDLDEVLKSVPGIDLTNLEKDSSTSTHNS